MPFEQTTITADENHDSVDLPELIQYFPDLTVYNYLFDEFNQLNSNVQNCFKEVQLLLEEGKNNDALMGMLVNSIAKIDALTLVAEHVSKKQIRVNDLKQKLIEEFNPNYHRYRTADAQLKHIKKTLAENLYEVFSKFKKVPAINSVEILPESIVPDNEENSDDLDEASNTIINEKLERSAIYLNKLINGEVTDWAWSTVSQLQLINQITKTAEQLFTEYHFTAFNAWQKNILFARLHAGFSWTEPTKSLETSLNTEQNAVTKKLLEEPFKSDGNLSFAEEEFLLDEINLTLAQLRVNLPNFHELLEMQAKAKLYLEDCKNLPNDIFQLIDSLLRTFKHIMDRRQGSDAAQLTLLGQSYNLTNNSLEQYLKKQQLAVEEQITKLTKMSDSILATKELPVDEEEHLKVYSKLKMQFSESNQIHQQICNIKTKFLLMKEDLLTHNFVAESDAVRKTNQEKLLRVQKLLRRLDTEAQSMVEQLATLSEKSSSEDLQKQQQIIFFAEQQKLFFAKKQSIETLTIDDKNFSQLDNLNHDMHEAIKNMKGAYRYIKGFKAKNSTATEDDIQAEYDNDLSSTTTATPNSPSFFKKHWQKLLFNTFLFSLVSVAALVLSGGLLPLATLLADALLISTSFAGSLVSLATAGIGGLMGITSGSIGVGFIGKPSQGFWKNHGRDVVIGTAIGLAAFTGVIALTFLGCATFGMGPLAVLSAFGSATAASLTVFGANITTAAGIGVGFSLLTTMVAAISATTTAFIAAIFDGKRKQLPPPNAQPVNQLTEVINPDIDPESDANNELTHKTVNKKISGQQDKQTKTKNTGSQEATRLTVSEVATLLTSFADTPKISTSPHGFHHQDTGRVQTDATAVVDHKPGYVR